VSGAIARSIASRSVSYGQCSSLSTRTNVALPNYQVALMWTTREVRQRQCVIVKQETSSRVIVYPSCGNAASFDPFLRLTIICS
jgi:hypothetical protein